MNSHILIQTNPPGENGEFHCLKCGREGLTVEDVWDCPVDNPPEVDWRKAHFGFSVGDIDLNDPALQGWGIIPPVCLTVSTILTLAVLPISAFPTWAYLVLNGGLALTFMGFFAWVGGKGRGTGDYKTAA